MPDILGNLSNILYRAKFTEREEKDIRKLLESPEIGRIIERAESELVNERASLKQKLDSVESNHKNEIEELGSQLLAASEDLEKARLALNEAIKKEQYARGALYGAEMQKTYEDNSLRQQLYETRDKRIDDFLFHLDDSRERARGIIITTEFTKKNIIGGVQTHFESNLDEIKSILSEIDEARNSITSYALLPLSRHEISERLTSWTHKLTPILGKHDILCPYLDESGEVKMDFKIKSSEFIALAHRDRIADPDQPAPVPAGRRTRR
ncbi:hypothetical protein [Burkholderia gladioli]|uniref:hypothetical protein n=1 Tax=Burkholderia gladioli TaxID=28095 RepID=UPI0013F5B189|nr:hypothetical protein [Burkholderia gladioli]NHH80712.1 hypothetical protein [Burkholderia gladioli]